MKYRAPLWLAAVAVVGLLASCKTGPTSGGVRVESYPQTHIVVNSKFFDGWFEVSRVSNAKREDLLVVQVSLENKKGDCQLEYRFRWMDADGIELLYDTGLWKPTSSASKGLVMLNGIAPNPEVTDYVLDVRMRQTSVRW